MRLFWFALKQCLNAFQTLAPARLATPAAGPFLPQNGRKNFASPHCASLQNFAFILVQSPLKIALSCPFSPFPAFLHSSVPPRQHFITLHENSQSVQPLRSKVEWMHRTVKNLQSPKSVQNFACDVLSIYDHIPLCRFVWFGLEQWKHPLFREQGTRFREARFREIASSCGQKLCCFHCHWFSIPENRLSLKAVVSYNGRKQG